MMTEKRQGTSVHISVYYWELLRYAAQAERAFFRRRQAEEVAAAKAQNMASSIFLRQMRNDCAKKYV